MDVIINNPMYLNLLWVAAAVGVLLVAGLVMRTRARKRFADVGLWRHLLPKDKPVLQKIRVGLLLGTLVAMALTMADIRWGKQWTQLPQRGIDIMFVVDVSRSMLARDARPNRLERAKQYIRDVMDEMGGDRAGLVVFAGKARQKVPLTSNYSDIGMALDEIAPQSVPRGGSQVGEAIRIASNCFVDKLPNHKAIIVFSDGEDQASYPVEAAKSAYEEKGICVFTVGLGDAKDGARIPLRNVGDATLYLKYQGKEVWSKMKPDQLKAIALAGGGAFIPAGTKQVNMADVYHSHIAEIPQREFRHARVNQYLPRYQWFAAAALLLLLLETLLAGRENPTKRKRSNWLWDRIRSRRGKKHAINMGKYESEQKSKSKAYTQKTGKTKNTITSLLIVGVLFLAGSSAVGADSTPAGELVRQANQALTAGKVDEAISTYQQAEKQAPESPQLKYNQAVAEYRKGRYDQAHKLLAEALAHSDATLEAKAKYNLGNCDYAAALQHVTKKEKDKAIHLLENAITQYQEALEVDTNDTDARANIELAQLMIDQLKKEEKQKQQQQKKQNQKQEQNKNQQKQKQNQKKNQDQKNQSKQNQDQKKQQDKQQKKDNKSQAKPNPQDQNKKDQDKQQQKQSSKPQKKQDEKKKQPQNKEQKNEKQNKQEQKQSPENPQKKQEKKQQQAQRTSQQPREAKGKPQAGDQTHVEARKAKRKVPPDQARRMLQAVRDKNLKRRREKLQHQRAIEMPVEKDW